MPRLKLGDIIDDPLRLQGRERVGADRAHRGDLGRPVQYQLATPCVINRVFGDPVSIIDNVDHDAGVQGQHGKSAVVDFGLLAD